MTLILFKRQWLTQLLLLLFFLMCLGGAAAQESTDAPSESDAVASSSVEETPTEETPAQETPTEVAVTPPPSTPDLTEVVSSTPEPTATSAAVETQVIDPPVMSTETITPAPTEQVTAELTAEAPAEATPTAETTAEPTAELTAEPTAEVTAEPVYNVRQTRDATFVVNSTGDASDTNTADNICQTATPGECTLRAAIQQANVTGGQDVIVFAIPGVGVQTIAISSALPTVSDRIILDGYTQPGAAAATGAGAATILIIIDGSAIAAADVDGLRITSDQSIIKGVAIGGFSGAGIRLAGAGSSKTIIQGNHIGLNAAGDAALPNQAGGILLENAFDVIIGGTDSPADRNVISGNAGPGIAVLFNAFAKAGIYGNYIGTDADGTAAIGNEIGVEIADSTDNSVGANNTAGRNIISGNTVAGVLIRNNSQRNRVQGNYIGLDRTGASAVPNASGVSIQSGAFNNDIGGNYDGATNVISGNSGSGIAIDGASNSNRIQGNRIGTNAAGTTAVGNVIGVQIVNASFNTIGGTNTAARNLISGNQFGVRLSNENSGSASTTQNTILGNYIGINADGTASIPNTVTGIALTNGAQGNNIGDDVNGGRNVISGNGGTGITIDGANTGSNNVLANYIGLTADGAGALGNGSHGVLIENGSTGNTIGGTVTLARNVIGGNDGCGVFIDGAATSGNVIRGNSIGLAANGATDVGNTGDGVTLNNAPNNVVGGELTGAGNIISGNAQNGVKISGAAASGNQVRGNLIGLNAPGTAPVSNDDHGVLVEDGAANALIGGPDSRMRNVISGNIGSGVYIDGSTSSATIQGNYIGTNIIGASDIGNAGDGITIDDSPNNLIGGTLTAARNIISGNDSSGVRITGDDADGNQVYANYIGVNVGGTLDVGNLGSGVVIEEGAAGNIIGSTLAAGRNLISGNGSSGVVIADETSTGNQIEGNYIGTNISGEGIIANDGNGVSILNAPNNNIGDTDTGARNLISGNGGSGVFISGASASGIQLKNNYIGTDDDGNQDLGNAQSGVVIDGAPNNRIGDTASGARNLISGNTGSGVVINGAGATGNVVYGNIIGMDISGGKPLGNGESGVFIGSDNNLVGTVNIFARNLISANGLFGVHVTGEGNTIASNYIGTDTGGAKDFGNLLSGVQVEGANNIIGGTDAGAGNLISGNNGGGVTISGAGATGNRLLGNLIGLNVGGTRALGNTGSGVFIGGGAANNLVGGTEQGDRNVISSNSGSGVVLSGAGTTGNQVINNYVGTNATGTAKFGNQVDGVSINAGADSNIIGGLTLSARNIIANNRGSGIKVQADDTFIRGNFIGTDVSGSADFGNFGHGILIGGDAQGTTVGGEEVEARNLIAFNDAAGLFVSSADSSGSRILGNSIHSNTGLGIDLFSSTGVTINDVDDVDTGANALQNYPQLVSIDANGLTASLDSLPDTSFRIEFFSNPQCDPSGFGEGQTLIGAFEVMTDGNGLAEFLLTTPTQGRIITVTATNLTTGDTSEFSPCFIFSALSVTSAPRLNSPANRSRINDTTPTLAWGAVANATFYDVEVATDSRFTNIIFTGRIPARSFSLPLVLGEGLYHWRTRGVNSAGVVGSRYSSVASFTVDTTPPTAIPVVRAPASNAVTDRVRPGFSWNRMTDAANYRLLVDDAADFSSPEIDIITRSTGYTHNVPLAQGEFYWKVAGIDAAGNEGAFSSGVGFVVNIMRLPSDQSASTSQRPTFRWSTERGQIYQLQVDELGGDFGTPVFACTTTGSTCRPGTNLLFGEYQWRVNINGVTSPFVRVVRITPRLPGAPRLSSPSDRATVTQPQFQMTWGIVVPPTQNFDGPYRYEIWIDNDSRFGSPERMEIIASGNSYDFDVSDLPVINDGIYYWRVRTINVYNAAGSWSRANRFTLDYQP